MIDLHELVGVVDGEGPDHRAVGSDHAQVQVGTQHVGLRQVGRSTGVAVPGQRHAQPVAPAHVHSLHWLLARREGTDDIAPELMVAGLGDPVASRGRRPCRRPRGRRCATRSASARGGWRLPSAPPALPPARRRAPARWRAAGRQRPRRSAWPRRFRWRRAHWPSAPRPPAPPGWACCNRRARSTRRPGDRTSCCRSSRARTRSGRPHGWRCRGRSRPRR